MSASQLTVLIASRNRRNKLIPCLNSLLKNTQRNIQLIVVDQSTTTQYFDELKIVLEKFPDHTYISSKKVGKSKGLNEGLRYVHTPYVAFTNDDCLVDTHWVSSILSTLKKYPEVSAVFGQTRPYLKHQKTDSVCPCTTPSQKAAMFNVPVAHWQVGYGNNMTVRLEDLKEIHGFQEWLGPGTVGAGAEDAACILQLLIKKKMIRYEPSVIVFHDKWLTLEEFQHEELFYITGEAACYLWLRKQIPSVTHQIVNDRMTEFSASAKKTLNSVIHLRLRSIFEAYWVCRQFFAWIQGAAVACFYSLNSNNNSIPS